MTLDEPPFVKHSASRRQEVLGDELESPGRLRFGRVLIGSNRMSDPRAEHQNKHQSEESLRRRVGLILDSHHLLVSRVIRDWA